MPAQPAQQIRNDPLVGRLLSDGVARPLPADIDWRDGVNFLQSCGGARGAWGCADTFGVPLKNISDSPDSVTFDTFVAYHQAECDGANQSDAAEAAAITAYTRLRSAIWATELHTSQVGNPDLVGSATDLTPGGGPVGLCESLIGLIDAQVQCGVVDVLLHAPLHAMPALLRDSLVVFTGTRYLVGGVPISFDLYPNLGPTGNPHDPPAANEAWLYATGPVEYASDAAESFVDAVWRQNKRTISVEQHGILRFDPCCVNAVLATIC